MSGILIWIDRGDFLVDWGYGGRVDHVTRVSGGRDPFPNMGSVYCGSSTRHWPDPRSVPRDPDGYPTTTGRDFAAVLCPSCRIEMLAQEAGTEPARHYYCDECDELIEGASYDHALSCSAFPSEARA
jgi:hypothetical protein